MKRTCWTTGIWRSCLSLEVVSSIPAGSMLIYRFLWGFICVPCTRASQLNPKKICQWVRSWFFRESLVACSVPSHRLDQFWAVAIWTLQSKLKWNCDCKPNTAYQGNVFVYGICKISTFLFRLQCVELKSCFIRATDGSVVVEDGCVQPSCEGFVATRDPVIMSGNVIRLIAFGNIGALVDVTKPWLPSLLSFVLLPHATVIPMDVMWDERWQSCLFVRP